MAKKTGHRRVLYHIGTEQYKTTNLNQDNISEESGKAVRLTRTGPSRHVSLKAVPVLELRLFVCLLGV